MVAVIGMGVLIVAGVAVMIVVLVQRMSSVPAQIASSSAPAVASAVLDEPAGTRIVGIALAPDRLAVQLGGGGPDRVAIVDTKAGRVLGRVQLAR
jgi:hypothetical protein